MSNVITETPWGTPDEVTEIAPGIFYIVTPSHGGLYLNPEANAKVPSRIKKSSFLGMGFRGWYEEDCDAPHIYRWFNLGPGPDEDDDPGA